MSRSSKKGPYINPKLIKKTLVQKDSGDRKPIKTWYRSSTISPDFVGHTYAVHNGKTFISVFVTESMVGHKLGEFSHSHTFRNHGGKMAKTQAKS